MADSNYTVFNAMVDIVASPAKALEEVKGHTSWLWWPLLISILLAAGVFAYYYSWVDFEWFVEEQIRMMPPEQQAVAADGTREFMTTDRMIMITVASIVIMTFIIYLVQSLYLHLANKLATGADIRFGQWFSFSSWTAFVGIFGSLAALIVMLTAGSNQIIAENLQVLSINNVLIHASPGDPWFRWGNSLSLINIWMLVLMSVGYKVWTGASMLKSAIIACLPWVLIFGIWAVMILT